MEAETIRTLKRNRELEATLRTLKESTRSQKEEVEKDPKYSARLEESREEAKTSRQRWRIMKSVVAAVIAESGVDWVHDEKLRGLVLDDEDEKDED